MLILLLVLFWVTIFCVISIDISIAIEGSGYFVKKNIKNVTRLGLWVN